MATYYGNKAKAPAFNPCDGCAIMLIDKYASTSFADSDEIRLLRLPAGIDLGQLSIRTADLDAHGTPEIVFRVGYRACDSASSLTADDDYFAAAGQTTAQAGGTLVCSFPPIHFEEDVWVIVTVNTDAATDASGDIYGIAVGAGVGPAGNRSSAAI